VVSTQLKLTSIKLNHFSKVGVIEHLRFGMLTFPRLDNKAPIKAKMMTSKDVSTKLGKILEVFLGSSRQMMRRSPHSPIVSHEIGSVIRLSLTLRDPKPCSFESCLGPLRSMSQSQKLSPVKTFEALEAPENVSWKKSSE